MCAPLFGREQTRTINLRIQMDESAILPERNSDQVLALGFLFLLAGEQTEVEVTKWRAARYQDAKRTEGYTGIQPVAREVPREVPRAFGQEGGVPAVAFRGHGVANVKIVLQSQVIES